MSSFSRKRFFLLSRSLRPLQIHNSPSSFTAPHTPPFEVTFFSPLLSVLWDLFCLGKVIFPDPEITAQDWSVIYTSPTPERTYIWKIHLILHIHKYTCDPSYPERENKVFQVESYCLRCLIFSYETDSAVLWLGDRTKSLNLDCGGFTCVTSFSH